MRERRIMLGLTQQQMAALIGVTSQQAHMYEKGLNRVSAGRLYSIAQALGSRSATSLRDYRPQAASCRHPGNGCSGSWRATT
jgi:transcriptional regulator with XRE-family HTH domain